MPDTPGHALPNSEPDLEPNTDMQPQTNSNINSGEEPNLDTENTPTLKIIHWNMGGITDANWTFKKRILIGTKAEVICVNETHLKPGKKVSIEGYTTILHNRTKIKKRSKKGYGGVGIFIKNTLYNQFQISIIDQEREDILGMRLNDKISGKEFIVYSVYITPHNSTAGAPAQEMYTHLLTKSYEFNLADVFLIAGDLNSRIGAKEDFIEILDPTIPKRQILDPNFVKNNGEPFIEFLNESVCCVLNGRFDNENNNFTCIRNGESVVDWFVTPITNFKCFENFKVQSHGSKPWK